MGGSKISNFREMSSGSKERNSSIGGQTQTSDDSSPPLSSHSERVPEPVGRNDIESEMAMLMMQRIQKEGGQLHRPSLASSIGSSMWSSSGGDQDDSESYAWSVSLNSDSSDDSNSSSFSGSSYDGSSSDDEEDDQVRLAPLSAEKATPQMLKPGEKKYPQPPAHMMGAIPGGEKKYPQPPAHMMMGAIPGGEKKYPQPPAHMMMDAIPGGEKKYPQPPAHMMMGAIPGGEKKYPQPPAHMMMGAIPGGEKKYPQPPPGMMEGLPFGMGGFSLESLKRDLEKVGRAILASNAGEVAAERAQTLASINWLASHVPNAVLDQLGHETRKMVADEKAGVTVDEDESQDSRVASVVESDAMSDVSDLSQEQLNLDEFGVDETKGDPTDARNSTQSYGDLSLSAQHTLSNAEEKKADEVAEDLPGGVPALLSPKPSKSTMKPTKKVSGLFNSHAKPKGFVTDLGVNLSVDGEPDDGETHQDNTSTSLSLNSDDAEGQKSGSKTKEGQLRVRGKRLPYSSGYRCALLFVDISGFTKLSTKLDPEALSKAINSYFQLIVDVVLENKGDLLKFAGDAVFIEWKATQDVNLETCVGSAVKCGADITAMCADFSVLENGATEGSGCLISMSGAAKVETLNVHCGVGAGQMVGVHVGDHELRREYLLLGQPIQQATVATDIAKMGEVAVSPEAHALLSRVCRLDKDVRAVEGREAVVVANRSTLKFTPRKRGNHAPKIVNAVSRGVTKHVEGLETQDLRKYRRMMSLYVHPVVVDNDFAAAANRKQIRRKIEKSEQERHREEAEIRNVYVMFVNPVVETKVTKNEKANREMFKTLNEIMNLASREIKRYCGHLRQFIVDDKGLVMIITFGLRGTTIPDMVARKALPATISIHNAIVNDLGIPCKTGATIGEAYCGVVGGVKRHEYAVLGPSVNLAARLMASKSNPGILVDNNVRMLAHRSFGFNALPPVVAKGYAEPVPIFEPLSPLERSWGKLQPNFVGRKTEMLKILGIARDMLLRDSPSRLVLVEAKSGMGKSTMVAHCIEHIRKLMGANKHRLIVTKNVSKDSEAMIPFGVFRSVLRDVLKSHRESNDDRSVHTSGASIISGMHKSLSSLPSLSGFSSGQSTMNLSTGRSSDIIQSLCRELDVSPSFVDYILQSLLGLERVVSSGNNAKTRPPSARVLISFMVRAFKRCTQDARLVVVALDGLHEADEYSWKAIREIYETTQNVLFIGTSLPEEFRTMKVDPDFWGDLTNKHKRVGRFITIGLEPLSRDEITLMIMKSLGLREKEVKGDVLDGITIQSGGLPHFVSEILEFVKRQMAEDPEFEISDLSYESFGDLILQRLDNFDLTTRNMLNVGGVIGLSFTLDDVVAVLLRNSDTTEAAVRSHAEAALQVAVDGGILECTESESDLGKPTKKFSFHHAVWRTALLNLMLGGRKRDLHRSIAETLESQKDERGDYMFNTQLFHHWISCYNFEKAAELALEVGRHFEERLGLPAQSIRLYNDSLDLLREDKVFGDSLDLLEDEDGERIGGFSKRVFEEVDATDLAYIVRLQVALGRALGMAQRMTESVTAYQDTLKITQAAKSARQFKDRSILFPVFTGLSQALKRGHIVQDAECKYEKAMLRRYVQEAKIHGDPIKCLHAMILQADMFARLGEFENAIESHKTEIEPLYDVGLHFPDLCDEHESDIAAQSFSNRAMWHMQAGQVEDAQAMCWLVFEEIMPKIEKRNVHAAFLIMFPVMWVMKDNDFAIEARDFFDEYVCEAYTEYFGEGRSTFFLPLYDPVMMLLDLTGNPDTDEEMMIEYVGWAVDVDNLGFGTLINTKTGEMGRTADSIAAEICYILAQKVDDPSTRATLIENGLEVASEDLHFTREKNLLIAEKYSAQVLEKLEGLEE